MNYVYIYKYSMYLNKVKLFLFFFLFEIYELLVRNGFHLQKWFCWSLFWLILIIDKWSWTIKLIFTWNHGAGAVGHILTRLDPNLNFLGVFSDLIIMKPWCGIIEQKKYRTIRSFYALILQVAACQLSRLLMNIF